MKRILLLTVCALLINTLFVSQSYAFTFGGEIPWPLSNQHVVTVSNSQGLWQLDNKNSSKLFNVEMNSHPSGYEWIRVSELDPQTYEVISWGEGFFNLSVLGVSDQSSFSNILVETGDPKGDRFGRYISMYPNGDLNAHPYMVRIVEVETSIGNVLGMSIINYSKKKFTHFLGKRVYSSPLSCAKERRDGENLKCFLEQE